MGFLSAVLPGLREARTPFLIGSLWIVALLLAVPLLPVALTDSNLVNNVKSIISGFSSPIQIGALAFVAYFIGTLPEALKAAFATFVPARLGIRSAGRGFVTRHLARFSGPEAVLQDAMHERYPGASYSTTTEVVVAVLEDFDLAARRLNGEDKDSVKFAEYSKLTAEAELRSGIWLPLLAISILAAVQMPLGYGLALAAFGIACSALTFVQGVVRQLEANRYLAQAIYLRWTSTPFLDRIDSDISMAKSKFEAGKGPKVNVDSIVLKSVRERVERQLI